jgi:streptomycin 6-kinase
MALIIPERLALACQNSPEREAWLTRLPAALRQLERQWSLTLGVPFADLSCSFVAPVSLANGRSAVLKVGMPHMENAQEIDGLRFWNGDPTVRLLEASDDPVAMLLERCEPGIPLSTRSEPEQDVVIARLLRRLWRAPAPYRFRQLSAMTAHWIRESTGQAHQWPDRGLVSEGLQLLEELTSSSPSDVLLATDLHAGNVLRAQREEWLVIDPKPFVGDPAYDLTQHLFNCEARLRADPDRTIRRVAALAGVDYKRVRLWTFARAAAEPRDNWTSDWRLMLAPAITPL